MGYLKKTGYKIIPQKSFLVFHNCSRCGRKTYFHNTKKFRINANGRLLDVWLVYQCGICRHTLNLAIYERKKVSSIPEEEYKAFLDNDEQLATMYGKDIQLFKKNKAEISFEETGFEILSLGSRFQETTENDGCMEQTLITIYNPYGLKIRPEKQIARVMGLSASQVKKLACKEKIRLENISPQFISARILYS